MPQVAQVRRLLSAAAILLTLLASCSQPIDPGPCELPECFPLSMILSIDRSVIHYRDSTISANSATAQFYRFDTTDQVRRVSIPGGDVRLNDFLLALNRDQGEWLYERRTPVDSLRTAAPGQYNVWQISGKEKIPPFSDSVATPPDIGLSLPAPGDTLSLSTGFTVTFTQQPSVDAPVSISVIQYAGTGAVFINRTTVGSTEVLIASDELLSQGFVPGPVLISATQFAHVDALAPEKLRYRMSISSAVGVSAVVK